MTFRTRTSRTLALSAAALAAAAAILTPTVVAPASAAPLATLTTSTPQVDAGTGVAQFTVTGLPAGKASLQVQDPKTKTWRTIAPIARTGRTGTATASTLLPGADRLRVAIVKAGKAVPVSGIVTVKAYAWYGVDGMISSTSATTSPVPVTGDHRYALNTANGCTSVSFGIDGREDPTGAKPAGWSTTITVNPGTDFTASATQPVGALTDIPVTGKTVISTSVNPAGAGYTYALFLQARCVTSPF